MKKNYQLFMCLFIMMAGFLALGNTAEAKTTSGTITESKAYQVARKHAKVKKKNILYQRINLDREDGVLVYEVEMYTKKKEFDYEIKADNGEVLSYSMEVRNINYTYSTKDIGRKKAKKIALKNAGIKSKNAVIIKNRKEMDDGIMVYELEFVAKSKKYDYDIQASNGRILSYSMEKVYN